MTFPLLCALLHSLQAVIPVANAGIHPLTGWHAELGAAFSEIPGGVWTTNLGSRLAPVLSVEAGTEGSSLKIGAGFHSGFFAAVLQPAANLPWQGMRRLPDSSPELGVEARLMTWLVNLKFGMWGLESSRMRATLGAAFGL